MRGHVEKGLPCRARLLVNAEGISLRTRRSLVGSAVRVSGRRPIRGCYRAVQPTVWLMPAKFERCDGRPRACAGEQTPEPPAPPTRRHAFGERTDPLSPPCPAAGIP